MYLLCRQIELDVNRNSKLQGLSGFDVISKKKVNIPSQDVVKYIKKEDLQNIQGLNSTYLPNTGK